MKKIKCLCVQTRWFSLRFMSTAQSMRMDSAQVFYRNSFQHTQVQKSLEQTYRCSEVCVTSMPLVLKSTHLDHGGMTQTAKQSCEAQGLCKAGKQYPNNGILEAKNLPEPPILCLLIPFIIQNTLALLTFSSPANCSWQMETNDQIPFEKSPGNSSMSHLISRTMGHFVMHPNASAAH